MSDDRQTRWNLHYDIADHLGWDLRMIADRTDERAGFVTMDAMILRRAASCFDGLPEEVSHDDALKSARESLK